MADGTAKKAPAKKTSSKKTSAKKTSAQKTSAKKTSAQKTSVQKAPAKKAPARKASARTEAPRRHDDTRRSPRGGDVAGHARAAVLELTGRTPEAVTGLERTDEGWNVDVEVLELERIPSTTDVLATYRVTLDDGGELVGCRRVHRFLRGSPGDQ